MKVWPIDPLVPRNLRLEVPEKLPQGLTKDQSPRPRPSNGGLVRSSWYGDDRTATTEGATHLDAGNPRQAFDTKLGRQHPRAESVLRWTGHKSKDRGNPQPTRPLALTGVERSNARQGVGARASPEASKVRATPAREGATIYRPIDRHGVETWSDGAPRGDPSVPRNWLVAAKRS